MSLRTCVNCGMPKYSDRPCEYCAFLPHDKHLPPPSLDAGPVVEIFTAGLVFEVWPDYVVAHRPGGQPRPAGVVTV